MIDKKRCLGLKSSGKGYSLIIDKCPKELDPMFQWDLIPDQGKFFYILKHLLTEGSYYAMTATVSRLIYKNSLKF